MNNFFKNYPKNIYFIIIVLFTFTACMISRSSYAIFIVLGLITDGVSLANNHYYKKDLYYTRPMYIKAILVGILVAFIMEQRGEFIKYFILNSIDSNV